MIGLKIKWNEKNDKHVIRLILNSSQQQFLFFYYMPDQKITLLELIFENGFLLKLRMIPKNQK